MIDDSNKEEVLEKLDSVVWSYYIQIVSLNALIEIAENIDKIQIMKENNGNLKVQKEKPPTKEKKFERLPENLKKQAEDYDKALQEQFNKVVPLLKPLAEYFQRAFEEIFKILRPITLKISETKQKAMMRSFLIYTISIWESFLKEYLRIVLFYNWEVLLSVKKENEYKISYGELLEKLHELETLEGFRSELIDDYLYRLFYKNVDEISSELRRLKLIKLDQSSFSDWEKLREAYYRRNIVTHNNGIVNKVYCKKAGLEDRIGEEIEITTEYLQEISNVIADFIKYVHTEICCVV